MALPQPKPEFEQPTIEQPQVRNLALPPGKGFPGAVDRSPKKPTIFTWLGELLPFDTRKAEFKFFLLYILALTYVILFPFDFKFGPSDWTLQSLAFHKARFGWGDMAMNLVMFLPFGFLGVRAMRSPFRPLHYTILITLLALPVAYLLQYVLYYVPSRGPNRIDVLVNLAACFAAGWFGSVSKFRFFGGKRKLGMELWLSAPLTLAAFWVAYHLFPFVPVFSMAQITSSIAPLLDSPRISLLQTFRFFTGWLIFAHLCSTHMNRPLATKWLALILAAVVVGQVFMPRTVLTINVILGGLTALLAWHTLFKGSDRRARALAPLLMCMLLLHALIPFNPNWEELPRIHWLPLGGFLTWYIFGNIGIFFAKMFMYGGLVWLMAEIPISWRRATVLSFLYLCLIEVLQYMYHLPHPHIVETTDPVILLLMALWIKWCRPRIVQIDYIGPERRTADGVVMGSGARKTWQVKG